MNWAISNLTGGNRVSRAILVRYSAVPLSDAESTPPTPSASSSSSSAFSASFAGAFLHPSRHHVPGRAVRGSTAVAATNGTQIVLPLDVEETVTCFCRKARRKERDGDQNSTDTKLYLEESVLERKLPEADLKALVDLPAGLDYNEWLASHTLALFEHVNLVYGTISEFCTPSGCPDMTGPGSRTYLWFDEKGKKTRVAAPQYIDYVMTFTQKTVSDESIFPTKYANEFPSSFESIARKILRLQFHVIAHLYAAHFREIALLGLHTHLNLTFAHLTALHRRFNLIDEKETDVLRDLEVALRLTDDNHATHTTTAATESMDGGGYGGGGNTTTGSSHYNTMQQQQLHLSSAASTNYGGSREDVNSLQQQNAAATATAAAAASASLIDGDAAAPPICTQPESTQHTTTAVPAVFGGGGGGLIGGILGDFSSGEFGDTTRYCTSAVPSSYSSANNLHHHNIINSSSNTCNSEATTATAAAATAAAAAMTANSNNGAGALHLNFTNNNNHHPHTHHGHHHLGHHTHHPHYHHNHLLAVQQQQQLTQQQQTQNSGLIQCNANNAPTAASNASSSVSTASSSSNNTTATTSTTA